MIHDAMESVVAGLELLAWAIGIAVIALTSPLWVPLFVVGHVARRRFGYTPSDGEDGAW